MKNKKIHRLLDTMLFASLLTNTASFPLNAQSAPPPGETIKQTIQRGRLKTKINQKIKHIRKVVNGFKAAKFAIPALALGLGAGIAALALGVLALIFLIPRFKIKNIIEKAPANIQTSVLLLDIPEYAKYILEEKTIIIQKVFKHKVESWTLAHQILQEHNKHLKRLEDINLSKKLYEKMKISLNLRTNALTGKIEKILNPFKTQKTISNKDLGQIEKQIIEEIFKLFPPEKLLKPFKKRVINLTVFGTISAVTAIILGFAGTAMATIGAVFGLTPVSMETADTNVKQLEQIEKDNPGILTLQQKRVIAKFKKLQKDPVAQSTIKNLRLKNELTNIVNAAIQATPKVVADLGEKLARKIFTNYIKKRRQATLFQKVLKEYAVMNIKNANTAKIQRQLNKTEKKIRKLEKDYPLLRTALESSVQSYIDAADQVLEELRQELIDAVEKKGFRPQKIAPVIPLT